ncbi:MAG: ABC transporter permease subunit [Succinivibrionaceae bacterium]|jgi:ABC-type antimicrobial peptide transport system permease subunit|nr:ABC transporter permease subunit [Succinivibrionaceae bacterium]MCI6199541.1 ABC transporter permease subunit [Pseudomonadota bacterium]MDD6546087.1 ABC transporter permease subunit [Pseudomonadota bacterium]MDY3145225.1 ABC transporter permease subunit [Succinivibrionaceae bacterium]MDY6274973.1 ABC transporter permease subunit [Succinivibrionaceae bacterium]
MTSGTIRHWASCLWGTFRGRPLFLTGLIGLICYIIIIAAGTLFMGLDPYRQNISEYFVPPSLSFSFETGFNRFIMGTDDLGRDIFARVVFGARNTLFAAGFAAAAAAAVGIAAGFAAAISGNPVLNILRRTMLFLAATPSVLIAVLMTAIVDPSLRHVAEAVALSLLPGFISSSYRIAADELRKKYVIALRTDGAGKMYITRIILRNTAYLFAGMTARAFSTAIIDIASICFLGLGAHHATPELGLMISEGMAFIYRGNYWCIIFPGIAIVSAVLIVNIVGSALKTAIRKGVFENASS